MSMGELLYGTRLDLLQTNRRIYSYVAVNAEQKEEN